LLQIHAKIPYIDLSSRKHHFSQKSTAKMMETFSALSLIISGDPALLGIVSLSLQVSLTATLLAGVVGLGFGALVALTAFPGRGALIVSLNAMMGLPPVVVGLLVYLLLSRSGPLGSLGILFTPQAMVVAQTCLIAPIIAALSRQVIEDLWRDYREEFAAMGVSPMRKLVP
jgi:tungstate transport system permease protein